MTIAEYRVESRVKMETPGTRKAIVFMKRQEITIRDGWRMLIMVRSESEGARDVNPLG